MAHDAVMVGVGTALADDPDLTVREMGAVVQPVRVVLDSRLRLPVDRRLGRTAREAPVWLVHGADADAGARRAWEAAGGRLLPCETGAAGRIGIGAALAALGTAGLTRVYAEGGATVAAALIENGLADRLHVYSAGRVFGAGGMAAVAGLGQPGAGRNAALPAGGGARPGWRCAAHVGTGRGGLAAAQGGRDQPLEAGEAAVHKRLFRLRPGGKPVDDDLDLGRDGPFPDRRSADRRSMRHGPARQAWVARCGVPAARPGRASDPSRRRTAGRGR